MVSGSSPVSCVFALYIWILKLDNSDGIREMDPVSQSGCIYDIFLSTSIFKYNIVFNLYLHLSLIVTFFCFFLPQSILDHSVPAGPPAGAGVVALKQHWGLPLTEVQG